MTAARWPLSGKSSRTPGSIWRTSPPNAAPTLSAARTTTVAGVAPRTTPLSTSGRWPTATIPSSHPTISRKATCYAQWGHRYVLNLRPHEHYTRYFHPLEGGGPRTFRPVRGNQDVDSNGCIRANGLWRYSPDLRDPATRALIYSESGVKWTKDGVRPLQEPGMVVFKVNAANVVTSAKIKPGPQLAPSVSVSRDAGINWQKLAAGSGELECLGAGRRASTEYLVKVELSGTNALLSSIVIETVTQLNRPALPRLTRGPNRIQVRLGPQVETIQLQPSIIGGNHKKTVLSDKALDVDSRAGLLQAHAPAGRKGNALLRHLENPRHLPPSPTLSSAELSASNRAKDRVTLLHSWDGQTYTRDYQKSDDAMPLRSHGEFGQWLPCHLRPGPRTCAMSLKPNNSPGITLGPGSRWPR